jgi:hypothetical protein
VAGGGDLGGKVRVWDAKTCRPVFTTLYQHRPGLQTALFITKLFMSLIMTKKAHRHSEGCGIEQWLSIWGARTAGGTRRPSGGT